MSINRDNLAAFCPAALAYYEGLLDACESYQINTGLRVAHFLAQCAHESAGFTRTVENLNYSQQALRRVFGKYFPDDVIAAEYARQPERIANRVYANRMGNGDEHSGDGWAHRGMGLIQLTGKINQRAYSEAQYGDDRVLAAPEMLSANPDAARSAGWYWDSRRINRFADRGDLVAVTKAVNGGTHGLEDRGQWLTKAKAIYVD